MRRTVLFALVVVAGCRSGGPGSAARRLAAFLPDDAIVLAGADLDAVRAAPLGRDLPTLAWLAPLGVEAHDVLASWDGRTWLVAARGRLTAPPAPGLAAAGDVVVAGPPEAVRAAMERARAGRPGPAALLARAPRTQLWAVSTGAPMVPSNSAYARLLNAVGDITAEADFSAGLRLRASGTCRDESNAQTVAGALRAIFALARVADATVEQRGAAVRLAAGLSPEEARKLLDRLSPR